MARIHRNEAEDLDAYTYTKNPNWFDDDLVYRLDLKPVHIAMMKLVFRKTVGFHRRTAEISNAEFARYAGVSERTIRRAKKKLIHVGLLIVVIAGNGLNKTEYGVNFRNVKDTPSDSGPRASDHISPIISLPDTSKSTSNTESDRSYSQNDTQKKDLPEHEPPEHPGCPDPVTEGTIPEKQASKSIKSRGDNLSALLKGDLSIVSNTKKKQTVEKREKIESQSFDQKVAFRSVCFSLRFLGIEPEGNYRFLNWLVCKYGADAINEKLEIYRNQIDRGIKIFNFWGWLRRALEKAYQPTRHDLEVKQAKERAKCREKQQERLAQEAEEHRNKILAEHDDPEAQKRIQEEIKRCAAMLEDICE